MNADGEMLYSQEIAARIIENGVLNLLSTSVSSKVMN